VSLRINLISGADVVAIDPGKEMLGLSGWTIERRLIWAGWVPVGDAPLPKEGARIIMERPRARSPEATPGGVRGYQALIDIAVEGALYAGRAGGAFETVFPDEWKGSTSKTATEEYVVERRCKQILSPEELRRVVLPKAKTKHHNVWDAVGLGLVALGRAGRGVTRRS